MRPKDFAAVTMLLLAAANAALAQHAQTCAAVTGVAPRMAQK
ncbi:MAG: hypothetical protein AAGE76_03830 [Pseudomonadota bacterium]